MSLSAHAKIAKSRLLVLAFLGFLLCAQNTLAWHDHDLQAEIADCHLCLQKDLNQHGILDSAGLSNLILTEGPAEPYRVRVVSSSPIAPSSRDPPAVIHG